MKSTNPLAKDPICGMVVPTATAISAQRAGRSYYFCSQGCRQTFLAPEQELGRMRRRIGIALSGVLALAVLRAAGFLALATGVSLLSWAPIAQLPWLTWGVWLFLLATPVQVIGGWGFYTGAWAALQRRALNMDVLIALGTSVAYLYSVVVVFAPQLLPLGVDERGVYFEVSAVAGSAASHCHGDPLRPGNDRPRRSRSARRSSAGAAGRKGACRWRGY